MEDLRKIAQDENLTYLQKVAAFVDGFAAGEISGEEADAMASEAGIAPEDLLAVYNATYGEEGGINKVASDESAKDILIKVASDENSTYLEKCASIADTFAAGEITAEEGDAIAEELGLSPEDVASVFVAAYGDPKVSDIEKTAADESLEFLEKVAEGGTYLEKCAGVADAYMSGAVSAEDAAAIAGELGLELSDVDSVIEAAYGDVLEKEAKYGVETAKKVGEYVANKAKSAADILGRKDINLGRSTTKDAKAEAERIKKILGGEKNDEAAKSLKQRLEFAKRVANSGRLQTAKGVAKATGAVGTVGGIGYGATKLFGGKDKK